jgi:hypothetical protein
VLLTSAAGYNTVWDPCTAKYLIQAGVPLTWVKLPERGIQGNGHFMFIERNSDRVAQLVLKLIENRLGAGGR